ncbi:apolipo protein O-domain-containing protein [Suillus bovinus]|uniref:apolipo protein O-domain-containing protein n=1 Tax=Suillus bovinus TaxID=48563 RepID=UPI001B86425F|nr:apolipo protein O-domain-containing protein [Suillus bovinus]KAG2139835.1 apolipo protein O-domain-containing protein [Suillus bovinus]
MAVEAGVVENAAEGSGSWASSSDQTKLSIYPTPIPELILLDTPSALEKRIGMVRREITGYYTGVHSKAQGIIDRWISVEEKVETRIKSFRDPTEPLNPGLLYTGISALTTSVLTRSRALPIRILLPPAALCSAFAYFLPGTASRVGAYAEELEDRYVPRFGEIRRTSVAHSGIAWERAKEGATAGRESVNKGVKSIVESIEQGTGLNLKAMGWAQEVKKEVQSVANVVQKDTKAIESKSSGGDSEDSKRLV